ncbi:MAG: 2OG-Fe(II) oxygenase family protein, partial [Pseudomonadales bacterium]
NRRAAYVINLTPAWNADWGGLLHFVAADGKITDSFLPTYNAITLFQVPQKHFVSYVSPFAGEQRISITGWLRAR